MSNLLIFLLNNDWIGSTCGLLPSNQWKLDQNSSDFFWTATLNLQHLGTTTNSELVISLYKIYTSCFTVTLNSFYFIYLFFFIFLSTLISNQGQDCQAEVKTSRGRRFFSFPHCSFTTECWGGVWGMWASCVWRVNLESSAHHLLTRTSLHWQVILGWSRVKA